MDGTDQRGETFIVEHQDDTCRWLFFVVMPKLTPEEGGKGHEGGNEGMEK